MCHSVTNWTRKKVSNTNIFSTVLIQWEPLSHFFEQYHYTTLKWVRFNSFKFFKTLSTTVLLGLVM